MEPQSQLTEIKQVLEPIYGRELTNQEAFTAHYNLLGFVETLIEMDKQCKKDVNDELNNGSTSNTNKA